VHEHVAAAVATQQVGCRGLDSAVVSEIDGRIARAIEDRCRVAAGAQR
jgi:hypothetical protein